ncbi:MAG: hypothetical protein HZB16_18825 [Armatimonadetes bacterium]|nr:hypothetical protein [Armatimonadota bacterium]
MADDLLFAVDQVLEALDSTSLADEADAERLAAPLVAALRALTASAKGPDWREQSWDSYRYDLFELEGWCVTVPFAALSQARSAVVPVAAAERLLALPDRPREHPWDRREPGRAYRRYWVRDKRFLMLVAEIAARWPAESAHLVAELRRLLGRMPARDSGPVALACATLGLLDGDPLALARDVLDNAAADDLGARGELVLQALRGTDAMSGHRRADLLRQATAVARRTTAFVASNPFAACVEALSEAAVDTSAELLELVERAVRVKLLDWEGWQTALHAAGRATTHLAAALGPDVVGEVIAGLRRWERWLPGLEPWILVAGARGLSGRDQSDALRRALFAARRATTSTYGLRAEAAAVRLLLEVGAEGAGDELSFMLKRLTAMPSGRVQQLGLMAAVGELAILGAAHWADAARLAQRLRATDLRWLAWALLASADGPADPRREALARAGQAARRWRLRPPPFDVLVPLWQQLGERLPDDSPALARVVELSRQARLHEQPGPAFAAELMALGEHLATPPALRAVAQVALGSADNWWRLPLLALLADGAMACLLARLGVTAAGTGVHC